MHQEEDDDTPIVHNVKSTDENVFTNTELNSIQFKDICDTFSISREAQRELVYLIRTIIKNNEQDSRAHPMSKYIIRRDMSKQQADQSSFLYVQAIFHLLSCFLIHWIASSKRKPVPNPNFDKFA
jgi:hypothetical protein